MAHHPVSSSSAEPEPEPAAAAAAAAAAAGRRRLLRSSLWAAASLAAPGLIPAARAQAALMPTPPQTEGPFYPVEIPADSDADLLRSGSLQYGNGLPAWVHGLVTDTAGVPLSGAVVEIWQCDADGHYHHPGNRGQAAPAFQGFGRMQVARDGLYRFRTIRPAPYTGRTPHIHFKVRLGGRELLTTQMYVAGEARNARDFLWNNLSPAARAALTVPFTPAGDGLLQARFALVVQA